MKQVSEFEPLEDESFQPLVASYMGGYLNPPLSPTPLVHLLMFGKMAMHLNPTFPIFHVGKTCV